MPERCGLFEVPLVRYDVGNREDNERQGTKIIVRSERRRIKDANRKGDALCAAGN